MYISKLSIRNYRNFRNVSLNFNKGVNTIIGENGSGKTNLFHAIRILIDESMPRYIRFYESDFNRCIDQWNGHWIILQLEFSELDMCEEAQAIAMHKIGDAENYDSTKGMYCVYFRPKIDIRRKLFDLSQNESKSLEQQNAILSDITLNDYETIFCGRGNIDFSVDDNYIEFVGDFENIIFPNPDEERTDVYGIRISSISIPTEFACTYAKALRDVEADLRSYKDNPLLNLLRDKEATIDVLKKKEIENQVGQLNENISNLDEVKNVATGIAKTVKEAVGETYAPNVNIKSELPSDMEKLLQSLKLWVGDPDEDGYEGRLWELSLGGLNLIYISLKLLEFEKVKRKNKIANFILIEEPEAHIHNHIQKTLFQKLDKENTQIFISTHSTHISSVCKISAMNVLGRCGHYSEIYNPSNSLDTPIVTKLERYLDVSRTNLLFAKGVVLVEGDAEQILIPELIKKVLGISLDEIGISLINIGSTGFENVANLFHDKRLKRKCSIITDNDISIVKLPDNPEDDDQYEKDCRNSEISGKERKDRLNEFCKSNSWIEPFYAKYTFEVDFIMSGNSFEIIKTVNEAYKRESDKKRIAGLLKDKDVAISGKEVLRLAEKFGKGWCAIMISEQIDNMTIIPQYILEAIAFASPKINLGTIAFIARYRLNKLITTCFDGDTFNYKDFLTEFDEKVQNDSTEEAIQFYKKELPQDVLTQFISLINA